MNGLVADLFNGLTGADRGALGKAITLIESTHPQDQALKLNLISACDRITTSSVRIAVTGAPGVGKSTLIERFGLKLIAEGHKVAVLAIDPSSKRSGGSILGDKTRMTSLSKHPHAFIRPSPTSGILGGIGEMTRETIALVEAAGYDRVIVETVGVGQSETNVAELTDVVAFITIAGSGDSLQGIKRGILEVVDVVAVNKSDELIDPKSSLFATELRSALHLLHGSGEPPEVLLTSSLNDLGLDAFFDKIKTIAQKKVDSGTFESTRNEQRNEWFTQAFSYTLQRSIRQKSTISSLHDTLLAQVKDKTLHPLVAANELVKALLT